METRLLIDAIVQEVGRLVADLATAGGARTLVADVPDRLFLSLATALEAKGLSKKLAADMCGMALRGYQRRVQRLGDSATFAGRTLWEAVLAYLHEREVVNRAELERRFGRDEPQVLGSVLHDLVESALVFRTGTGSASAYRAAREHELAGLELGDGDGAEALVWLSIHRLGPIAHAALRQHHRGLDDDALEAIIERLLTSGRVQCQPGERVYAAREVVLGPGGPVEAALLDHVQALFASIRAAVTRTPDDPRRAWTGGSTYRFAVAPAEAEAEEVKALLPRLRSELGSLRTRADARDSGGASESITIYLGVLATPTTPSEPQEDPS